MLEERDKQASDTLTTITKWFKDNYILEEETQSVKLDLDIRLDALLKKVVWYIFRN